MKEDRKEEKRKNKQLKKVYTPPRLQKITMLKRSPYLVSGDGYVYGAGCTGGV